MTKKERVIFNSYKDMACHDMLMANKTNDEALFLTSMRVLTVLTDLYDEFDKLSEAGA